jgi:AraC-like DNA-binding protein
MRTSVVLADRSEFVVAGVTCDDDHSRWSSEGVCGRYEFVFVRRGRFHRRVNGVSVLAEPVFGYLALPGDEESFAHPAGGDICTSIAVSAEVWRALAGDAMPAHRSVYLDATVELAHRRLLVAAGSGDVDLGLAEGLVRMVGGVVGQLVPGSTPVSPSASAGVRARERALVASAREAVLAGHPSAAGLFPLAALLNVSPYRLSRAFTGELGMSLTRYRNRVRLSRTLERLARGERNLSALAADLGYSDHAHLARTLREHLGRTPTAVRDHLRLRP